MRHPQYTKHNGKIRTFTCNWACHIVQSKGQKTTHDTQASNCALLTPRAKVHLCRLLGSLRRQLGSGFSRSSRCCNQFRTFLHNCQSKVFVSIHPSPVRSTTPSPSGIHNPNPPIIIHPSPVRSTTPSPGMEIMALHGAMHWAACASHVPRRAG